jgi:hypothetical protein
MATLTGNNGVVKIDSAAGTPTALAAVRNFSVEITADTIEKTVMTNDTRQFIKGLSTWTGSADIYFDPTEMPTAGTSTNLSALNPTGVTSSTPWAAVGSDAITLELYLDGSAKKFSGEAIVTGFTINSSMDGMVEASISFQGTGSVTYTA